MSTVPGHETWRDAGLVEVDPAGAVEVEPEPDLLADTPEARDVPDVEEYEPPEPRPDLIGEAEVTDVTEQAAVVPSDEREEYP
ncbi:hypothetical protein [Cellulomonas fimi]|uniref:Uncharacterized protein n=1 Tax=Cellulomonas fimi TaxID=1708 RepID=A0A7Y0LXZ6_CELFI|nr:hypothetical protein [Cellulomonas fimi]NMR19909.1 hypothetical protein [Cellulomonas fimi]